MVVLRWFYKVVFYIHTHAYAYVNGKKRRGGARERKKRERGREREKRKGRGKNALWEMSYRTGGRCTGHIRLKGHTKSTLTPGVR